jgi:hypothetical protein
MTSRLPREFRRGASRAVFFGVGLMSENRPERVLQAPPARRGLLAEAPEGQVGRCQPLSSFRFFSISSGDMPR